jgi:hypothetical protein
MTQEEATYCLAARFPNEKKAGATYFPLQQMIFEAKNDCDLSVYRFKLENVWHVVVLGEQPPQELHQRIEAKLTAGTLVRLRQDALDYLLERRARAIQLGPWVEGHYKNPEEGG